MKEHYLSRIQWLKREISRLNGQLISIGKEVKKEQRHNLNIKEGNCFWMSELEAERSLQVNSEHIARLMGRRAVVLLDKERFQKELKREELARAFCPGKIIIEEEKNV